MSKPYIHALSASKRWGVEIEDTIEIHNFLDSSKSVCGSNLHRLLTHNAWFIGSVLERVFGTYITAKNGKIIQVRDVGEKHVLEDFGNKFIPSAQDYLECVNPQPWMLGRGTPPSFKPLERYHSGAGKDQKFVILD